MTKIVIPSNYAQRRRAEYPELTEQLDALWKGGGSLEEMRQRILGVKAKYPKPNRTGGGS